MWCVYVARITIRIKTVPHPPYVWSQRIRWSVCPTQFALGVGWSIILRLWFEWTPGYRVQSVGSSTGEDLLVCWGGKSVVAVSFDTTSRAPTATQSIRNAVAEHRTRLTRYHRLWNRLCPRIGAANNIVEKIPREVDVWTSAVFAAKKAAP